VPEYIFHEASPADRWVEQLAQGTVWVAEDSGELVAFLAGTRHGDRLHIDEFDVAQSAQGRGLGRRILESVIEEARRSGLASLSLTTFRSVPWNGPFYASCGFAFWDGDFPPDVAAAVAHEAERGLTDRCAMRLTL
jgi:GNAT superfamily N-acetyltransferase